MRALLVRRSVVRFVSDLQRRCENRLASGWVSAGPPGRRATFPARLESCQREGALGAAPALSAGSLRTNGSIDRPGLTIESARSLRAARVRRTGHFRPPFAAAQRIWEQGRKATHKVQPDATSAQSRSEQRIAGAQARENREARFAHGVVVAAELDEQCVEAGAAAGFGVRLQTLEKKRGQRVDLEEMQILLAVADEQDQSRLRRRLGRLVILPDPMHRKAVREYARKRRDEWNADARESERGRCWRRRCWYDGQGAESRARRVEFCSRSNGRRWR